MTEGVVNVLKPPGMTSHDVVSSLRKIYSEKRIGHMGTLDPAAAGVLPAAIGKSTRLIEFSESFSKSYRAQILFGIETDTGDDTGVVFQQSEYRFPLQNKILTVLDSLIGQQIQQVPVYSAVKVDGRKLYELARSGVEVEPVNRTITIHDLKMVRCEAERLVIDVHCSKGAYIRSLCVDIGHRLGIPATMYLLIRTQVGPFSIENALTLEEIEEHPRRAIQPSDIIVSRYDAMTLQHEQLLALKQGKRIPLAAISYNAQQPNRPLHKDMRLRIYDADLRFWGVADIHPELQQLIPYKMMETPIAR